MALTKDQILQAADQLAAAGLTLPIPRNCKISQNDRASALLESLAYCVVRSRSL